MFPIHQEITVRKRHVFLFYNCYDKVVTLSLLPHCYFNQLHTDTFSLRPALSFFHSFIFLSFRFIFIIYFSLSEGNTVRRLLMTLWQSPTKMLNQVRTPFVEDKWRASISPAGRFHSLLIWRGLYPAGPDCGPEYLLCDVHDKNCKELAESLWSAEFSCGSCIRPLLFVKDKNPGASSMEAVSVENGCWMVVTFGFEMVLLDGCHLLADVQKLREEGKVS